jgi:hypothetical protein
MAIGDKKKEQDLIKSVLENKKSNRGLVYSPENHREPRRSVVGDGMGFQIKPVSAMPKVKVRPPKGNPPEKN